MATLWFILVAFMLAMYVVLDGFDLGAGAIHLFAARDERRAAADPAGDRAGLGRQRGLADRRRRHAVLTFPLLYASGFSGFYLPLIMVLWLLMLRGMAIELRSHFDNPSGPPSGMAYSSSAAPCWRSSSARRWPTWCAACRSTRMATSSSRSGPTSIPRSAAPGILDWYTILIGLLALAALTMHGADYIAVKTEGAVNARARRIAAGPGSPRWR